MVKCRLCICDRMPHHPVSCNTVLGKSSQSIFLKNIERSVDNQIDHSIHTCKNISQVKNRKSCCEYDFSCKETFFLFIC